MCSEQIQIQNILFVAVCSCWSLEKCIISARYRTDAFICFIICFIFSKCLITSFEVGSLNFGKYNRIIYIYNRIPLKKNPRQVQTSLAAGEKLHSLKSQTMLTVQDFFPPWSIVVRFIATPTFGFRVSFSVKALHPHVYDADLYLSIYKTANMCTSA